MLGNKTLLVLGFVATTYVATAQNKKVQVLAIASYNCENFFDTLHDPNKKDEEFTPNGDYHYTYRVYKEKLHNIATVIAQLGTDITPDGAAITGLVEVENNNVLKDLVEQPELSKRSYQYVWFYGPDERGISPAMLYNPKYFKLLYAEPIRVKTENLEHKRPTRDVLHVYGILAGDTVHILVNHWPSKSGGEAASAPGRLLAAGTDKNFVDSLLKQNPAAKILILGDFNDNPTSAGIINVLEAKETQEETELNGFYNPWIKMYKRGLGTENYKGEWNLIDQVMLSGAFVKNPNHQWKFYKADICQKDFLLNKFGRDKGLPHRSFTINKVWDNGYSDHFPVVVYLVKQMP